MAYFRSFKIDDLIVKDGCLDLTTYNDADISEFHNYLTNAILTSTFSHFRPIGVRMAVNNEEKATSQKDIKERVIRDNGVLSINPTTGMSIVKFMFATSQLILSKCGGSQKNTIGGSPVIPSLQDPAFSFVTLEIDSRLGETVTSSTGNMFYSEKGTSNKARFLIDDLPIIRPTGNQQSQYSSITFAFYKGAGIWNVYKAQEMLKGSEFVPFYANFSLTDSLLVRPYLGDKCIRFLYKENVNDLALSDILQELISDMKEKDTINKE